MNQQIKEINRLLVSRFNSMVDDYLDELCKLRQSSQSDKAFQQLVDQASRVDNNGFVTMKLMVLVNDLNKYFQERAGIQANDITT